jgi:hypothetical protein
MKYSLRSLMTFSIRDIALVTVIVALALLWWTERSRLQRENWRLIREKDYWRVQYFDEQNAHIAASRHAQGYQELHAEAVGEADRLKRIVYEMEQMQRNARLPTSLAPAPNLSKP